MIIGISGYAQSGKTTVANILEEEFGYTRKHIATPLRAMLVPLLVAFGIPRGTKGTRVNQTPNTYDYLEGRLKEQVIPGIGKSGRYLQIKLGTEWGRVMVDAALWVNAWGAPLTPSAKVINDSVRFPNEGDAIRALGGFTLLITRPGLEPVAYKWGAVGRYFYKKFGLYWGVHDSERLDRLTYDETIVNDGTLDDLRSKLRAVVARRLQIENHQAA